MAYCFELDLFLLCVFLSNSVYKRTGKNTFRTERVYRKIPFVLFWRGAAQYTIYLQLKFVVTRMLFCLSLTPTVNHLKKSP